MDNEQALWELEQEGLRIAKPTEAGWYWKYTDTDGESVTLWVTDDNS